jgi:hypothetical protein
MITGFWSIWYFDLFIMEICWQPVAILILKQNVCERGGGAGSGLWTFSVQYTLH